MNRLCGTRTYLAGAMDRVKDGGIGWRNDITPFLEDMGVVVLDPCKKEWDSPSAIICCSKTKFMGEKKIISSDRIRSR